VFNTLRRRQDVFDGDRGGFARGKVEQGNGGIDGR
jgi:hypothetical protein